MIWKIFYGIFWRKNLMYNIMMLGVKKGMVMRVVEKISIRSVVYL